MVLDNIVDLAQFKKSGGTEPPKSAPDPKRYAIEVRRDEHNDAVRFEVTGSLVINPLFFGVVDSNNFPVVVIPSGEIRSVEEIELENQSPTAA